MISARKLILIAVLTAAKLSPAQQKGGYISNGVKVELSMGIPSVSITNPDGSKAGYSGIATNAKGFVALFASETMRFDLTGSFKYLDLKNAANSDQKEFAQYIGPGAGFELSVSRFFLGADYMYIKGRHSSVGYYSNYSEFDLTGLNYYYGLRFDIGQVMVGISASRMTSEVAGTKLGLSKNNPWGDSIYWLNLAYDFKIGTADVFKSLFGSKSSR